MDKERELTFIPRQTINCSQSGTMDELVVNNQLTTTVVDNLGTDATTAISEGVTDSPKEITLGNDGEALLNITSLSHSDNATIITEVQDAVSLVHGTKHGLDNNGRGRVSNEARLLLKLAGEEVDAQVSVLAGLRGDGDTDDLAGTALQDEDVADADEVAGDGDGFGSIGAAAGLDDADVLADAVAEAGGAALVWVGELVLLQVMLMRVDQTIGGPFNAAAKGVVLTLVVVVTHFANWDFYTRTGSFVVTGRRGVVLVAGGG